MGDSGLVCCVLLCAPRPAGPVGSAEFRGAWRPEENKMRYVRPNALRPFLPLKATCFREASRHKSAPLSSTASRRHPSRPAPRSGSPRARRLEPLRPSPAGAPAPSSLQPTGWARQLRHRLGQEALPHVPPRTRLFIRGTLADADDKAVAERPGDVVPLSRKRAYAQEFSVTPTGASGQRQIPSPRPVCVNKALSKFSCPFICVRHRA